MFEDSKKQSALESTTLTNVNSLTASNAQTVEAKSNHPQETELSPVGFQDITTDSNNHESVELSPSNFPDVDATQEYPEGDAEPSEEDSMKPQQTPMLSQFWWLWKRKKTGGRR